MVMPMLFACAHAAPGDQSTRLTIYEYCANWRRCINKHHQFPAQGIGTNLSVDVRVITIGKPDHRPQGGVTGVSYMVTWDPAVLSLRSLRQERVVTTHQEHSVTYNNSIDISQKRKPVPQTDNDRQQSQQRRILKPTLRCSIRHNHIQRDWFRLNRY